MRIAVAVNPPTTFSSFGKTYRVTYPENYQESIAVRVWKQCEACGAKYLHLAGRDGLCGSCADDRDPNVQLCKQLTGLTPIEYQCRHRVAWNE